MSQKEILTNRGSLFGEWMNGLDPKLKTILGLLFVANLVFSFCILFFSTSFSSSLSSYLYLGSLVVVTLGQAFPLLIYIFKNKKWSIEVNCLLIGLMVTTIILLSYFDYFFVFDTQLMVVNLLIYSLAFLIFYLEARIRTKALSTIDLFLKVENTEVRVSDKNQFKIIKRNDLKPGDIFEVKAGEMIPVDGEILQGTTSVDESHLRGENIVSLKEKGDEVLGSSYNRDSTIMVEIKKPLTDHFKEKLKSIIVVNLNSLFELENKMNRFSLLFFILGLGFALGIYLQNIIFLDQKLIISISVLSLVSITIWLRLATIILYFGLSRLSTHGVYFSVLDLIRKVANLDYLFCEKTGTLTRGKFHYSQYSLEMGVNQGDFLSAIFSLEKDSKHPLATAMETHPWYVEIPTYPTRKVQEHIGLGICGEVFLPDHKPKFIVVGNARFLKRNQMYISKQIREKIEELEAMGETVILCGWDRQTKGVLSFSDNLRLDVQSFLEKVKKLKMKSVMITGDHDEMVGNLAYTKQLENIYTRCLPEEKANKIRNRQDKSKKVGMLGFKKAIGPAFDQADVSILFGLTKIPEKNNSILILGKRLLKVTDILLFSRQIWSSYKAHFRFGLVFSLIGIGLVGFNLINPLFAFLILFILHGWVLIYPLSLTETSFDG